MIRKLIVAAALVSFSAGTAFAADYYVAHQPNSSSCVVTQGKPDGKTWVQVGDTFQSQKAAEKDIKKESDCKK